MTRKSRREIERAIEDLSPSTQGERPAPLSAEQKAALSELFDADPWSDDQTAQEVLATIESQSDTEGTA